ncbi:MULTISPECIES: TetR/AcrR family transcriptional regulator [unclassified Streptomyces]|uniref:TetR/AcrR family transcriptional regulator n=1 Tax=Streptomyces sp. R33 TaxID=3238629 RepID=A0AB39YAX0_9ACTN|nr:MULTISPECIES: TetR/AcrR family transcriptional regulator [unclassified Streptomyces]KJY45686.1 TetR family transcriptional regulator [Streptomyces sp. NRRL S-444]KOY58586.1 TetR family transcriptional regulator [Streptomyces sp. XY332]THA35278.1 TetR/AcrR family transcriptional regulator [Streptomyces sp. A1547]
MLTPKSSRPTPERLLDAAETLMRTIGLANTTTKAIAREAGCSEAALYKHYANKEELFVRVLMERTPNAGPLMAELAGDHDERSVEEALTAIARHASLFYADAMPMAASLFAEPALLTRHREGVQEIGTGPHVVRDALTGRLRRELERGRLGPGADPEAAAELLLGACFQRAFFLHFSGPEVVRPVEEFAPSVARTLWAAIR